MNRMGEFSQSAASLGCVTLRPPASIAAVARRRGMMFALGCLCPLGWLRALSIVLLLAVGALASSCASSPQVVEHGFSFDARRESPDVTILDYRYGQSRHLAARAKLPGEALKQSRQFASIYGAMSRPDTLYVQWIVKSSGVTHEDSVDLHGRLPTDISKHEIRFVVRGPQLCVYLISPQKRPQGMPEGPLRMYRDLIVTTIYPDAPASQTC